MAELIKTAEDQKKALAAAIKVLWKEDAGLFQNLFRLLSYAAPAFAGFTLVPILLSVIAKHTTGLSIESLGEMLDDYLGTGPGSSLGGNIDRAEDFFYNLTNKVNFPETNKMSKRYPELKKEAGIWSAILKNTGTPKLIVSMLKKLLTVFVSVLGFSSIDHLITKAKQEGGMKNIAESILNLMEPAKEGEDKPEEEPKNDQPRPQTAPKLGPKPKAPEDKVNSLVDEMKKKYQL